MAEALPGTGPEVAAAVGADPGRDDARPARARDRRRRRRGGRAVRADAARRAAARVRRAASRARRALLPRRGGPARRRALRRDVVRARLRRAVLRAPRRASRRTRPRSRRRWRGAREQEADAVVAAYDFGAFSSLVDVGGGRGVLLDAILRTAPSSRPSLFDRPAAVEAARAFLGERASCVVGDFFESVPAGADAYLLSRVLHDWDDEDALRILRVCREAMGPPTPGCSSSTRSCPSAPSISRSRSGWTCTCCCCSARASGPRRSSATCSRAPASSSCARCRRARPPASA